MLFRIVMISLKIILIFILSKSAMNMKQHYYYPSPLSKNYLVTTSHPKPPKNWKSMNNPNEKQKTLQQQKYTQKLSIRYKDGLLVPYSKTADQGIFFSTNSQHKLSHYGSLMTIVYQFQKNQKITSTKQKMVNNHKIPQHACPHGRNYLLGCNGIRISAQYKSGTINSWLIGLLANKFIVCQHYRQGVKDGHQYHYRIQQKQLTISKYSKGTLIVIEDNQSGCFTKLINNSYINQEVLRLQNFNLDLPQSLQPAKVGNTNYLGEQSNYSQPKLNDDTLLNGYGVLFSNQQLFMGNFAEGYLSGLGFIKFSSPQKYTYYYGDLNNGICRGYGCYRNGADVCYKFGSKDINKQQFDQFIRQSTQPEVQINWLSAFHALVHFYLFLQELFYSQIQTNQKQKSISSDKHDHKILNISANDSNANIFKQNQSQIELSQFINQFSEQKTKSVYASQIEDDKIEHGNTQHIKPTPIIIQIKQPHKRKKSHTMRPKLTKQQNNKRQEITCLQMGTDKDFVMNQRNSLKPNLFNSKTGFMSDNAPNLKKNTERIRVDFPDLYREDTISVDDDLSFLDKTA